MTDLEQELTDHLRRRAAAATPRYDLEAIERDVRVISPADRPRLAAPGPSGDPDERSRSRSQHPARSRRRLVGVAAAVTLLAAGGVALVQRGGDRAVDVTTSSDLTQLYIDLPADSTAPLPPAPTDELQVSAAVTTGAEVIVWGGIDAGNATVAAGAAFDLATGTWRVIADAPIEGRAFADVAWTGTEMIVWGGQYRDGTLTDDGASYNVTILADGAAYNPTTDTWRRLPDAPIDPASGRSSAVWTGDEFIVIGGGAGSQTAAYDPLTNRWRQLADAPRAGGEDVGRSVWTGTTILTTIGTGDPWISVLARYDPATDTWDLQREDRYAALVGIPEDDGVTRTVIGLPSDSGAPVDLLDASGRPIERLPGAPVDVEVFGDHIEAETTWVGDEALFWIVNPDWGAAFGPPTGYGTEAWALNPETRTWRALPAGIGSPVVATGDLLVASSLLPDGSNDVTSPLLYRAPTTGTADSTDGEDGGA